MYARRSLYRPVVCLLGILLMAGCAGPRMKRLYEGRLDPLPADSRVEVFVGRLNPPFQAVALLDSEAYPYVDDDVKLQMLEELKRRARRQGANTLHEVRILPKQISGFTIDERVPFTAWKQGQYQLYFMRAEAVLAEPDEPTTLAEVEPDSGWVVDQHEPPRKLTAGGGPLPMPNLQMIDVPTSAPTEPEPVE